MRQQKLQINENENLNRVLYTRKSKLIANLFQVFPIFEANRKIKLKLLEHELYIIGYDDFPELVPSWTSFGTILLPMAQHGFAWPTFNSLPVNSPFSPDPTMEDIFHCLLTSLSSYTDTRAVNLKSQDIFCVGGMCLRMKINFPINCQQYAS